MHTQIGFGLVEVGCYGAWFVALEHHPQVTTPCRPGVKGEYNVMLSFCYESSNFALPKTSYVKCLLLVSGVICFLSSKMSFK